MTEAELESLLSPLPGAAPCGADLQHDPDFLALEEAAAGKPEREYGTRVYPAEPPDWLTVHPAAIALAGRSRDLRLAIWLLRSGTHVDGFSGAVRGLQLVHGLVARHWQQLHPRLDEDDPSTRYMARLNALQPLVHPAAFLADLRAARLVPQRGALTVRDIELAIGRVDPLRGETVPTEEGVIKGLAAACKATPALAPSMLALHQAAEGIAAVIAGLPDTTNAPELSPLTNLTRHLAKAAGRVGGAAAVSTAGDEPAVAAQPSAVAVTAAGQIGSREDAIKALGKVCDWIERNEPANPAPLFIRRSQSLLTKNFIDIVRDLMPDAMKQVEHFAGKTSA